MVRWFGDETDHPPFLKALEDVRRQATREGWCYHHVQAIIVSIDQYAEAATGNREYFLNNRTRSAAPEREATFLKAEPSGGTEVQVVRFRKKRERDMRKVLNDLDTEQREALLYVVDLGIALCASGLIVSMLRLVCDVL